jgi:hypothetical protein
MFEITINGQKADLKVGESVVLERQNPLLNFDTIPGAIVNDFELPFSPKNDKIFDFAVHPQTRFTKRSYYCEKKADGVVIEKGTIELIDITEDAYVVAFTSNLSEFFGDYQRIMLNKLPLGSEVIPTAPEKNPNYLTAKYCWPTILNAQFYGTEVQAGWSGKMNEWTGTTLNANARVPMMFMRFVLDKLATLCNFSYSGTFVNSEVFKRMLVYNTFSLDDATSISYANHLPELSIIDFLVELRKLLNLRIMLNPATRVVSIDFADIYFAQSAKLDWTKKAVPTKSRSPIRDNRLELNWSIDTNDGVLKVVPTDFDVYRTPGEGFLFSVNSAFSTLQKDASGFSITSQKGITPRFAQGGEKFAPRLLFWNNNSIATNEHDIYRLSWRGTNNIPLRFWANFEAFRLNTAFKTNPINLNAVDVETINWMEPDAENVIYIKGKEYIIDYLKVILPLEGVAEIGIFERNL